MVATADRVELQAIEQAYRVLGVSADSSALRIKREYRRLARLWHPDKFADNTNEQRRATERMREINNAYALAKQAPLRYRYDVRSSIATPSGEPAVRRTAPIADTAEYIVRFVAGFAFGLFVSLLLMLADAPLLAVVLLPVLTAGASAVFGDRFWYWVLKHWWLWSP
jgi:preprotein translocase subunit Sec63